MVFCLPSDAVRKRVKPRFDHERDADEPDELGCSFLTDPSWVSEITDTEVEALTDLAGKILALTKLNWNKTQFDSFYPITLGGSKRIGEIYKWCLNPADEPITYAFFM